MALIIIDSDILIDVGRGEANAITCVSSLKSASTLAISTVTEMELVVGCRNKHELQALEKFLTQSMFEFSVSVKFSQKNRVVIPAWGGACDIVSGIRCSKKPRCTT
jgi:predicted nucleic acid-binding protein